MRLSLKALSAIGTLISSFALRLARKRKDPVSTLRSGSPFYSTVVYGDFARHN